MSKENEDAKSTDENPSASSDESPASSAEDTETSKGTEEVPKDEKTLAEVVAETIAKSAESSAAEDGKGAVQTLDETKKAEGEEDPKAKEGQEEELPPFHEHPRWKEVVAQRDELRSKAEQVEAKVKEYEPIVNAHKSVADFCINNGISPEEMQQALNFLALSKTDPAKALEVMTPVWQGLQTYKGEVLPHDLESEVKEGTLTRERAKEIAHLRADSTFKAKRYEIDGQQAEARRQQEFVQQTTSSVASWEKTRREKDPDFVPKAKESDPDGKYEMFLDKMQAGLAKSPPKTAQEAVALVEKAYQAVCMTYTKLTANGKPKGSKVLSSSRSSATRVEEPKTIHDVVAQTAAKHGISMD